MQNICPICENVRQIGRNNPRKQTTHIQCQTLSSPALATVRCENRALAVVAKIDKRDKTIKTPTLIIQGGRDTFGNMAEVSAYELSPSIDVRWMPDGDHRFKPRKKTGGHRKIIGATNPEVCFDS